MKFLKQFIKRGDALGELQLAAKQLEALARRIRRSLPEQAATHVSGCAVRKDALVVFTDNAVWASQLRYQQNEILAVARESVGGGIRRVQFKVLLPAPLPPRPPVGEISPASRRLLRQAAGGIADDELAEALRRLAGEPDQDAD